MGLHGVGEVLREAVSAYRQDHSSARLEQVRTQLAKSHPSETLTRIAAELSVGLRALQRRLARAGTTLKAQVAAERLAQARVLLSQPDLATVEVAFALGFSDQTAFTRAFRRWTGESPAAWRRARIGRVGHG